MNIYPFTPMTRMDDVAGSERRPLSYESFVMSEMRNSPSFWWKWTMGVLCVTCVCAALVVLSILAFKWTNSGIKLYLTHDELDEKMKNIYNDAKETIQVLLGENGKTYYEKELENYDLKEGNKDVDVFKEATMSMFERAMEHGSAKLQKRMVLEKNLRQKGT